MEIEIKFRTPGKYLSMQSMFGVVSDIRSEIELAIVDAISDEYPKASKEFVKKKIKGKVDLSLSDAKKGSWEILLIGVAGSAIGGVIASLSNDLIKDSEAWRKLKDIIYKTSDRSAKNAEHRLQNKKKLGPFEQTKRKVEVVKKPNGSSVLKLDVELKPKSDLDLGFDLENEVDDLIKQLKDKSLNK